MAVDTHVICPKTDDRPARPDARVAERLREAAPSTELRPWYGRDTARFGEFRHRCLAEPRGCPRRQAAEHLRLLARQRELTSLTATWSVRHSQAAVLTERPVSAPARRLVAGGRGPSA
ncbi:DUF488 family protein [Amycolatopsis sp. FDAARGOS 1241]|uniref:DUF488 family protein, N3 subclade n=1 Tax=Amycolatopsis sp. FDAARGOS 1241 TaxID=2778070 RepID=UPI001951744B|nr:DUF488 family protein [Amycolatopsis sp. FDAARGOS 1241]QRP42762.1 DUF488 family protein [Amycolatopsis sp. FDAARGOS 1241]